MSFLATLPFLVFRPIRFLVRSDRKGRACQSLLWHRGWPLFIYRFGKLAGTIR